MFNFVRVLLGSFVLFSSAVFANDGTYWIVTGLNDKFGSAVDACVAGIGDNPSWVFDKLSDEGQAPNVWGCQVKTKDGSGSTSRHIWASRRSCPVDTVFNAQTGQCEAPSQCEAGQSSSFEFLYCYNYDGGNGCSAGTSTGRPGSFCRNSCVHIPDYNPSTTDADCYAYQNGDGSSGPAVFCSVTAETNGSECSGEYTPDSPDNSCPSGTVPGQLNGKNVCIPSGDGGGDGGDNGGGDGGDNGGGDGGDNGGGDGGDDGGGDGGDNGGGDGGGDGGGNGNGNGGGDGDGSGNGDGTGGSGTGGEGDGDGDGSGGSGEGVDNCESGRCDFGDERGDPFGGEVRSFADSLTAAMNGMKNSPLGNSIGNIQFPTGGSCPTGSTSINIGIGSIPIDFTEHCNFWQQIAPILSAVFLALWAIIAVRVFLSA